MFVWIVIAFLAGAVIAGAGLVIYGNVTKTSARKESERYLAEARQDAEKTRQEASLTAKQEIFKQREQFELETQEIRKELKAVQKRLEKREESVDGKLDLLNRKEKNITDMEAALVARQKELQGKQVEVEQIVRQQKEALHRVAGMTREEAVALLLSKLKDEVEAESARFVARRLEDCKENSAKEARRIISIAIQRVAAAHTTESVVAAVDIPSDEMKGRVIGREGRNIRAFEKATGVDVVVDDTPGVIVVSCFEPVRREIARRSLEKLVQDGRIHPTRIEELVETSKAEVDEMIEEKGKEVVYDMGLHRVHPRLVNLLGRLQFRSSYGQNALQHSLEVAHLCGVMAGELKLDVNLAKRCGLLHDIGKALDHDKEGGHPEIGAELVKNLDEAPEVIEAVAGHHEDGDKKYLYTILTQAADAISASRPGARKETFEKYIKRLEGLEEVAKSFAGVEIAYAIQAGREVRVIVDARQVDDNKAMLVARDIAKSIEAKLNYPGEIKVSVSRETRFVEYAR